MSNLTAAYIAMGYIACTNPPPLVVQEHFDGGQLELINSMVHYAEYLDALCDVGCQFCGGAPGVFLYEVAECFGPRYALMVMACEPGCVPSLEDCCNVLISETADFFMKGFGHDTTQQQVDGLVEALAAVPRPEAYQ